MPERLQIVDENDQPVRVATREEAWKHGWILRHAYIVLRDDAGNFLLQQRSKKKKSNPGKWTWAATGHVDVGETYEEAAPRECFEEIGIQPDNLQSLGKIRTTQHGDHGVVEAFIMVFIGTITRDAPIRVDKDEVELTKWFTADDLSALIQEQPELFSPNMRRTYIEFFL